MIIVSVKAPLAPPGCICTVALETRPQVTPQVAVPENQVVLEDMRIRVTVPENQVTSDVIRIQVAVSESQVTSDVKLVLEYTVS